MAINPNWPIIEDAWGAMWNANGGTVPADRYVDVTARSLHQSSTKRGRQYELDQVQAGEYQASLDSHDGAFDPTNTAGPWSGSIKPYQPFRKRAQWPPTANLLTQFQASGGEGYTSGIIPASASIGSLTDGSPLVVASGTAWQGSNVFEFDIPSATGTGIRVAYTAQTGVRPGQAYTLQMRVRNVTAATSQQVKPVIAWYGATAGAGPVTFTYGSSVTLTGSATAPWTQVTVTATAPASVYGMAVGVSTAATVAATCAVQVDGWQLEKGSTASAWTLPGIWYPLYSGFMERLPSIWSNGGTYGEVTPTAVDAFALLSQRQLSDALTEEINSHNPRFLYRLDDPAGSALAADSTGNNAGAPLINSKYGSGSFGFGQAITAADTTTGVYTGSDGTIARFNNPNPGTSASSAGTYLALSSAGVKGPANASLFTRMVAFRYTGPTPASGAVSVVWTANTASTNAGIAIMVDSLGHCGFTIAGPTGTSTTQVFVDSHLIGIPVVDGNWHLAIVAWDGTNLRYSLDGNSVTTTASSGIAPTGCTGDFLGGMLVSETRAAASNFAGDVSFVGEFPSALTTTDMTNIYSAWKSSCVGESTGARYARILRYSGYSGATNIATGLTSSMGPANDIDGTDVISALQAVVDTESGAHFVAADGTITFRGRDARYNALTPVYTFGEGSGEYPYEDCQLDYDSTHLANFATITQVSTGQTFTATDGAAVANYMTRTFQRSINSTDPLECQDAANYLVSRYRNPLTRVTALKLHPSAYPALWPVVLGLELGTRIRVMRRPFGAPAIQLDLFVENIAMDIDDTGEAWVTLQCSPVDPISYGVFSAWFSTIGAATIPAGTTSISVNNSADNTNPLAAQLTPGQSLVLDPGTAMAETVHVAQVGATSAGWTTAVITLQAPTVNSHVGFSYISEPLLAGQQDPSKWNAVSVLDSVALAY